MKNGRGSSLGLFLECFDGKGRTKTTRGDGVLSYPSSKLSFVACIQPQLLSDLMQGTDYAGQWSRILFPSMPTRLLQLEDSDPTDDEQQEFRNARVTLENLAMELYKLKPSVCNLTAEARAHVNAWFRPYQRRAIDPTTPQILQSMFNKGMAHAMRVAITLHKIHVKAIDDDTITPALLTSIHKMLSDAGVQPSTGDEQHPLWSLTERLEGLSYLDND
jgi:hypothetical protein